MNPPASGSIRPAPPTSKEKNAVQREVNRLLDELAPERATTRGDRPPLPIQKHRTPNGCILQAPAAAVSVTWYSDAGDERGLGELQIVLWSGVVTRRGAVQRPDGAAVVRQQVLHPIERPADENVWRDEGGMVCTTAALAAHCLEMLAGQMSDTPTERGD